MRQTAAAKIDQGIGRRKPPDGKKHSRSIYASTEDECEKKPVELGLV